MTIASINQPKGQREQNQRVVPLSDFEPLFNQLRVATDASLYEAMTLLGYAGGTHYSVWKEKGTAPLLALNAIRWVLHSLNLPPAPPQPKAVTFSSEELVEIFAALRGLPTKPQSSAALLKKVVKALSQEGEIK